MGPCSASFHQPKPNLRKAKQRLFVNEEAGQSSELSFVFTVKRRRLDYSIRIPMPHNLHNTHVKLLAFDLLSLTQIPTSHPSSSDTVSFSRRGIPLSRAEILGTVTFRDSKQGKFLKFSIDDGTGCVPCILWLNHLTSPYFSRRRPPDVRLIADMASNFASLIKIGAVARVRGRITGYRGAVQITVSDVVIERDPNMETLHWLDCVRLARKCYDPLPHRK